MVIYRSVLVSRHLSPWELWPAGKNSPVYKCGLFMSILVHAAAENMDLVEQQQHHLVPR